MSLVSVDLKRVQKPEVLEYFVNGVEATHEQYLDIYHRAVKLDSFHTAGAQRKGVKTYTHVCVAHGVPVHLVDQFKKPEVLEPEVLEPEAPAIEPTVEG